MFFVLPSKIHAGHTYTCSGYCNKIFSELFVCNTVNVFTINLADCTSQLAAIFSDKSKEYIERKLQACNFDIHMAISAILEDANGM